MLQGEHSAILLTFIKLPFVIKIFVLSIFEWLLKTGLTAFRPPGGFGCCLFWGGGSVVVDSLLIVTPIVGFCNCSMSILVLQSS